MAVSGANWRKSIDGCWTDAADWASPTRPVSCRLPPAVDYGTHNGGAVGRTLAANADRSGDDDVPNTVETDDSAVSGPLAIGVATATALVTDRLDDHADGVDADALSIGRPSGRNFDGDDVFLCYFNPDPGTRPRAVIDG